MDKNYFTGPYAANLLMTDLRLYMNFLSYKYIFNYHLDCYIFKNDLQYWIDKDFDQCECIFSNHPTNIYFQGEGLRKPKAFFDYYVNHQEEVENFKTRVITSLLIEKNNLFPDYGYNTIWFTLGEDIFWFKHISLGKLPSEECWKFGWSYNKEENYKKYGLPMMIHWYKEDDEWCKNIIGDPNNIEECINKEF